MSDQTKIKPQTGVNLGTPLPGHQAKGFLPFHSAKTKRDG
jgi:hypothetical protein